MPNMAEVQINHIIKSQELQGFQFEKILALASYLPRKKLVAIFTFDGGLCDFRTQYEVRKKGIVYECDTLDLAISIYNTTP